MELLWAGLVLVGLVAMVTAVVLLARRRRGRTASTAAPVPASTPPGVAELRPSGVSEVVARLSVPVDDPDRSSVRRLTRELAEQAFATSDRVERLVVQDRDGHHVVTIPRHEPPLGPPPTAPDRVRADGRPEAPHARRHTPPARAAPRVADDTPVTGQTLAARLELSDAIRDQVQRPDDAVDVIRAILTAGGHEARVVNGVLLVDDVAIVVVQDAHDAAAALGRAFLRFQRSGARSGVVVATGHVDSAELHRRDALVPQLAYVGPRAIQRMADAVDLGMDPLAAARDRTT